MKHSTTRHRLALHAVEAILLTGLCACSGGGGGTAPPTKPPPPPPIDEVIDTLNLETPAALKVGVQDLEAILAHAPSAKEHDLAHLLLGASRLALFFQDNAGGTTLADLLEDMQIDLHGASLSQLLRDTAPTPPSDPEFTDQFPLTKRFQDFGSVDLLVPLRASIADFEAVSPGWTETVDEILKFPSVEFDYGDCQLLAAALRGVEAGLQLQAVLNLQVDLYELDRNIPDEGQPVSSYYRTFCGDAPSNIVQGAISDSGRKGFLNEAALLQTQDTLDTTSNAGALLEGARVAMLEGLLDLRRAIQYVEDGSSADDFLYLEDRCGFHADWFSDVEVALKGADMIVVGVSFEDCGEFYDLPGFTLDHDIVFNPNTYGGRLFLPDYAGGATIATENSFDHVFTSTTANLPQLALDISGQQLTRIGMLDLWNLMNRAWDEGIAREVLEPGGY
jgi:hypothetical protein